MQGKMQSFTVTTALVFYTIILGQTPLTSAASTGRPGAPSTDDARIDDVNDAVTTESVYNPSEKGSVIGQADNQSNASNATTRASGFLNGFMVQIYNYSRTNQSWPKMHHEVTLYVLPNGTMVYGFPNGTFVNSSSEAIHFPNGTVLIYISDRKYINTTATTFLNGTTTFLFPNGTTLNSSEIFSLGNGTRLGLVEVVRMSNNPGIDDEEVDQRGMTTTATRGFTPRMPRRTTTTTTTISAPTSIDDDDGGRRPIRRKGAIPQPAPRPSNNEDVTTDSTNGNRRQQGNWFG